MKMKEWTDQQIYHYYEGIRLSDYPRIFWEKIAPYLEDCTTITDVGCGPGAFTLIALQSGYKVQAVDISNKNLLALQEQVKMLGLEHNFTAVRGDWLDVETEKTDAAVCAYCFGGSIGTLPGIEKVIANSRKAIFFISPVSGRQLDFDSEQLYAKTGTKPPAYKGDYKGVVNILASLNAKADCEIIEYDFGMPLENEDINYYALYLAEKLGINAPELVEEHIRRIKTIRNNIGWIPNKRSSAFIKYFK